MSGHAPIVEGQGAAVFAPRRLQHGHAVTARVEAAQAFGRALWLDQRAGNVEGAVASALSFGRAALRAPDEPAEARSAAVELHRTLLERPAGTGDGLSPAHEAALRANLSALLDRTATLTEVPE